MFTFRTRRRRSWLGAIATALVVSLAALLLSPMLEHAVRARIESAAVRHGAVARIGVVHVGSASGRFCDWRDSISTSVTECDCMPT